MSYAPGKYYVLMIHKDYEDAIRKFIADEALPVEIIRDGSDHLDIVTWIQERRVGLRALMIHTDFYAMQLELDHTKIKDSRYENEPTTGRRFMVMVREGRLFIS